MSSVICGARYDNIIVHYNVFVIVGENEDHKGGLDLSAQLEAVNLKPQSES